METQRIVFPVQEQFRASEEVKIILETRTLPITNTPNPAQDLRNDQPIWNNVQKLRVLVVVTHIDPNSGEEQGSVFIFRPDPQRIQYADGRLVIEHILPIVGEFYMNMAQPRRNTIDLRTDASPASNQSRTELTLTIYPVHDPSVEPISLLVRDTHQLSAVLTECKRLKQLSVANYEPGVTPIYPWLLPYATALVPSVLSTIPPDLRHAHRPLHTLLSSASAGLPGDDVLDVSLIREEWVKQKVYEQLFTPSPKMVLRVHLGTFNVNGKLPSQDLSPWVRNQRDQHHYIPAFENVSPLSIGKVPKESPNYFNETLSDKHEGADTEATPNQAQSKKDTKPSYLPPRYNEDPDLLVLAFQELDLSTGALLYSVETTREDAWCTAALAGLGEKAEGYQKLTSRQLVGMLLVVIVKKELSECFTSIQAASAGVGILGIMGNKGATALRLTFTPPSSQKLSFPKPTVLTFVNSHLAAFDEMYDRRNGDFHDLSKRLWFDSGIPQDPDMPEDSYTSPTIPLTVFQSDILFWMVRTTSASPEETVGAMVAPDLNYRLNLSDVDIRELLSTGPSDVNLSLLLQSDQLKLAMESGKAFVNFQEHRISYAPSYRFGTGILSDGLGYDMKRKPAWTDRILHMASPAAAVEYLKYRSHAEITMSDHRPVSADCNIHIPLLDLDLLESHVRTLWREVADIEQSDYAPRVHVNPSVVEFGNIFYNRLVSTDLELRNTGKVASTFRFVPITPEAPIHSEWLRVIPMSGLILPGESFCVSISIMVDNTIASRLNSGSSRMEDTLILHTSLGKDYFISVSGQYQRTCFVTSLERLVRHREHVRSSGNIDILPEEQAMNAPQEVMRLVNWLMTNAADVDSLFLTRGDQAMIENIRECLDTGEEFPQRASGDINAALCFASCLVDMLDALPEPVIPQALHPRCAQVTTRDEAFEVLDGLPGPLVNVWISLTAFLHYICHRGSPNPDSNRAERLAEVLTPVLLRDEVGLATPISPGGKRRFLLLFVT